MIELLLLGTADSSPFEFENHARVHSEPPREGNCISEMLRDVPQTARESLGVYANQPSARKGGGDRERGDHFKERNM